MKVEIKKETKKVKEIKKEKVKDIKYEREKEKERQEGTLTHLHMLLD